MDDRPLERGRAWIEIDLDSLAFNIRDIRSNIPKDCEIMAVVKANAYGHGIKGIAGRMVDEGIKTFAVATVCEGEELRKYVPDGEILVMGYTHPEDAKWLSKYRLTQLTVDSSHAKALNDTGFKINVHVAIDTGMHRLGIESSSFKEIESIFKQKNLIVTGVATHFASPDSLDGCDIDFTNKQMEKFLSVINKLKEKGYDTGKLHAQSSYAIYNYPEQELDYVRPGIMQFGVQSLFEETKIKPNLRPVLSLNALVTQVRWIEAGESVSYGRIFTADKPTKIATVGIGYADGIPRNLSGKNSKCIINGKKVPVIGRICMDMIIVDVTDLKAVEAGDIVTIIGKNGTEEIRCEEIAEAAGTITNDILAGLSARLPRIYY